MSWLVLTTSGGSRPPPHWLVRVSAQLYKRPEQYARLAEALGKELAHRR